MALPVLGGIAALLGSELLKRFVWDTLKWVAQRAFLLALCLGVGPIVLFKGFSLITRYMLTYAGNKVGGEGIQPITVQFVGVAGWMANQLMLPEAFSLFASFCLLSFSLRMIRVK